MLIDTFYMINLKFKNSFFMCKLDFKVWYGQLTFQQLANSENFPRHRADPKTRQCYTKILNFMTRMQMLCYENFCLQVLHGKAEQHQSLYRICLGNFSTGLLGLM